MNSEPILKVENLSLTIGRKKILSDISFSICKGEWLTIVGHNGSGKTSLIKSLLGLYKGDGDILINGIANTSLSRREIATIVSYVPQSPPSELHISVSDFLLLSRYPYRESFSLPDSCKKIVLNVAEQLKISSFLDRDFSSLSGGEKQKVMIGSALVQEAQIIFLDEPSASLDPSFTVEIMNTLKGVAEERNLTIIEVSHDINSAALFSDRVLALKNGTICGSYSTQEFLKPEVLKKVYDHPFSVINATDGSRTYAFPDYGADK